MPIKTKGLEQKIAKVAKENDNASALCFVSRIFQRLLAYDVSSIVMIREVIWQLSLKHPGCFVRRRRNRLFNEQGK
jgi:hypothetical protein